MDSKITSESRAVTTHVWRDPETEKELLCLTVGVPVVENVEFSLVGNGPSSSTAKIVIPWGPLNYEPKELFSTEIKSKTIVSYHPCITEMKKELQNHRKYAHDIPCEILRVQLPIAVQNTPDSIEKEGLRHPNGTASIRIIMKAVESSYTMNKNKTIVFYPIPSGSGGKKKSHEEKIDD